jgi:GTP-binding protein
MPPIIALVGRPNVGKSTLFNRLLRKAVAITHDLPGVTRDRILSEAEWNGRPFLLVDTGGLTLEKGDPGDSVAFQDEVFNQVNEAVASAQVVVFMVDGRDGITPLDQEVASYLRPLGKNVLLVVNKVDGAEREALATAEFHGLGLPLLAISSAHGFNLDELKDRLDELTRDFPEPEERPDRDQGLRIAVLGRPNAGKSSLINAMVGEKRLIVSPVPGTTRDAVDVTFAEGDKRYTFVDTAGVRRRTHITDTVEKFSVLKALSSSRKAQVTLLVLDGVGGLARQDKRLLEFLENEKVPFAVVVNKMDLVSPDQAKAFKTSYQEALRFSPHVPVVYVSALGRTGLGPILPLAEAMWKETNERISTGKLNKAMVEVLDRHEPPLVKGRRAKFYYLTQASVAPQTFVFFVNDPERVKPTYARYLENGLRKLFGIKYTPISVVFRPSHTPREEGASRPRTARPRPAAKFTEGGEPVAKDRDASPDREAGGEPRGQSGKGQGGKGQGGKGQGGKGQGGKGQGGAPGKPPRDGDKGGPSSGGRGGKKQSGGQGGRGSSRGGAPGKDGGRGRGQGRSSGGRGQSGRARRGRG